MLVPLLFEIPKFQRHSSFRILAGPFEILNTQHGVGDGARHRISHFLVLLPASSSSRLTSVDWCFLLPAGQLGKDPLLFFQFDACHCLLAHYETDKTHKGHTHTLGPRGTQSCSLHSVDGLDGPD